MERAGEILNALAQTPSAPGREDFELLKRTYFKDATDDEVRLFMAVCYRTGLDIRARQIYPIKRWDSRLRREMMQPQTSIDGFRLIADRSGKYEGQVGPHWCGEDGLWRDVWIPEEPPVAARVGVLKAGFREPLYSVAKYQEYVQTDRDGNVIAMWRKMPANQLAKCAEALSLRKAFPQEMSGLYTADELPPPGPAVEIELERPWRTFKEMLARFAEMKQQIGDPSYYAILEAFSVKHANEFRNSEKALAAYQQMREAAENFPPAQPEATGN